MDYKIHTHATYAVCDAVDAFQAAPAYTQKLASDKKKQAEQVGRCVLGLACRAVMHSTRLSQFLQFSPGFLPSPWAAQYNQARCICTACDRWRGWVGTCHKSTFPGDRFFLEALNVSDAVRWGVCVKPPLQV